MKKILVTGGTGFIGRNILEELSKSKKYLIFSTYRKKKIIIKKKKFFKLTWLRLFYIYGDNQQKRTLYSQFKRAVKNKYKKFKISKGDQKEFI